MRRPGGWGRWEGKMKRKGESQRVGSFELSSVGRDRIIPPNMKVVDDVEGEGLTFGAVEELRLERGK